MEISKRWEHILNKQFKMIGESISFADIPEDGLIEKDKKKVPWWKVYKFESEEQYLEWRKIALLDIKKIETLNRLDLLYGFLYPLGK